MAASRAKGTARAPGGSRSWGAALILLTLPPRSLGSSGGWLGSSRGRRRSDGPGALWEGDGSWTARGAAAWGLVADQSYIFAQQRLLRIELGGVRAENRPEIPRNLWHGRDCTPPSCLTRSLPHRRRQAPHRLRSHPGRHEQAIAPLHDATPGCGAAGSAVARPETGRGKLDATVPSRSWPSNRDRVGATRGSPARPPRTGPSGFAQRAVKRTHCGESDGLPPRATAPGAWRGTPQGSAAPGRDTGRPSRARQERLAPRGSDAGAPPDRAGRVPPGGLLWRRQTRLSDPYATAAILWSRVSMTSGEGASVPEGPKTSYCHICNRNAPNMSVNVGVTL